MNDAPPVLSVVPTSTPPSEVEKPADPGALLERHHKYADDFAAWLKGLNRHDFMQAKKVLEALTHAYFKHTVKVHSPPAKKDENKDDVHGTTSGGTTGVDVPDPPGDAQG